MIIQGYIQAGFDWRSIVQNVEAVKGKFVKVYMVVKEGLSNPTIIGKGVTPLEWSRKAVSEFASKVSNGLKAYRGHGATNTRDESESIGEVVGHAIKDIAGKLNHYVAIASETENDLDTISMEADITYVPAGNKGIVSVINRVTGLALGVKGIDIPGVEGAGLIASMQFFEQDSGQNIEPNNNQTRKNMTKEEIKVAIMASGGSPSDFFNLNQLLGKVYIVDGKIAYDGEGDYKVAKLIQKYVLDQVNPLLESQSEKIKNADQTTVKYKELSGRLAKAEGKAKIEGIVKARSLTDQHKMYLESVYEGFNPGEDSDADLTKFIDTELGKFKNLVDSGLVRLDGAVVGSSPPKPRSSDPDTSDVKDWEKRQDYLESQNAK